LACCLLPQLVYRHSGPVVAGGDDELVREAEGGDAAPRPPRRSSSNLNAAGYDGAAVAVNQLW
jgi:hypothetical protein